MWGDHPADGCTAVAQCWKQSQSVSIQIGRLTASSGLTARCEKSNRCKEVGGALPTTQRTLDPAFPLGTLVHQDNIRIHDSTRDIHQRAYECATLPRYCIAYQYETPVTKRDSAERT